MARAWALWLFVAAVLGAVVGLEVDAIRSSSAFWVLVPLLLGGGVVAWFSRTARTLGLLLFGSTLAVLCARHARVVWADVVSGLPGGLVVVEGVVRERSPTDAGARLLLEVRGFLQADEAQPWRARIEVVLLEGAAFQPPPVGATVRVRGKLAVPAPADSPGTYDSARAALARGVHGRITISDGRDVAVVQRGTPPFWIALREALRVRLTGLLTPREAGLLLALLIGDTSLFEESQRVPYRQVGAGHLLAVSGMQVTLLAVFLERLLLALLLLLPVGRRGGGSVSASVCALVGVWTFVLVCGLPPSAVRAGVMASVVLLARASGRRVLLLDVLGLAGAATIMVAPESVLDAGFLLSYAAVLGLALSGASERAVIEDPPSLWQRGGAVVFSSLAAGALTLPLSAWLFSEVAPAGLFANIVLVPAASLLQMPALLLGVLGALLQSEWIAWLGAQPALLLEALVTGLAGLLPGVSLVEAPSGVAVAVVLSCTAIAVVALASRRHLTAVVALLLMPGALWLDDHSPSGVHFTVLPVGQGDATVFVFPDGTVMLIDGGGRPTMGATTAQQELFDPGRRVVLPHLLARGIEKIDVVVVSHPHPDHAAGLVAPLEVLPVTEIWHNGAPTGGLMRAVLDAAPRARVRTTPELLGTHRFHDTTVEVLAPSPVEKTSTYPELGANDNSLVLRICYRRDCALWPGDLELYGEELLLADRGAAALRAEVVKAPHHGSRTSSTPPFVAATQARHVILTTGRDNHFAFPHDEVVERWRKSGAQLWDTAQRGRIEGVLTGQGVVLRAHR